jgi:hypothetical protein
VLTGAEQHHLIDALFQELPQLRPDNPAWEPKVRLIWDTDKLRHPYRKMEQLKAQRKKEKELGR